MPSPPSFFIKIFSNISKKRPCVTNTVIIILTVGIILTSFVLLVNYNNPFYLITSSSMLPTFKSNDVVVIYPTPFEKLQIGDIVVFKKILDNTYNLTIVHRVVEINNENNIQTLKTKGDNNSSSREGMDYPITEDEYVGKVILVIPNVGYIAKILSPPLNYILVGTILIGSFFLFKVNYILFPLKK